MIENLVKGNDKLAFSLFRSWKSGLPNSYEFSITDEGKLVKDYVECLNSCIEK